MRTLHCLIIPGIALCTRAFAQPLRNITIQVPPGTTDHGNSHLLCVPVQWYDIMIFFLGNYIAHAATVKSHPGESSTESTFNTIVALLCPSTGIIRALNAIFRRARFKGKSDLERAAQAGALCMLVRDEHWMPKEGDVLRNIIMDDLAIEEIKRGNEPLLGTTTSVAAEIKVRGCLRRVPYWAEEFSTFWTYRDTHQGMIHDKRKIHGVIHRPVGYRFQYVPRDAKVTSFGSGIASHDTEIISSAYSLPKALIAVVQTLYATVTLYRARGNQVEQYGYAAFGLTVTPYVLMSIINFVALVMTPDYHALYLVHNDVMDEAKKRDGAFDGVVGRLDVDDEQKDGTMSWKCEKHEPGNPPSCFFTSLESSQDMITHPDSTEQDVQTLRVIFTPTPLFNPNFQVPACSRFKRRTVPPTRKYQKYTWNEDVGTSWSVFLITAGLSVISLIFVGAISKFSSGHSTKAQRGWTMSWLVVSIFFGPYAHYMTRFFSREGIIASVAGMTFLCGVGFAPAIGGLIVVGQMISDFGTCVRLF